MRQTSLGEKLYWWLKTATLLAVLVAIAAVGWYAWGMVQSGQKAVAPIGKAVEGGAKIVTNTVGFAATQAERVGNLDSWKSYCLGTTISHGPLCYGLSRLGVTTGSPLATIFREVAELADKKNPQALLLVDRYQKLFELETLRTNKISMAGALLDDIEKRCAKGKRNWKLAWPPVDTRDITCNYTDAFGPMGLRAVVQEMTALVVAKAPGAKGVKEAQAVLKTHGWLE
ncbi:MAG: hypothetical protein WAX89_02865 [Alphaproteobacteria bacterium]